jgi:hypothetical protein
VANNECNLFWCRELRGHDEVAFVFAVFVVHHHDHFAARDCGNDVFNW